MFLSKSCRLCPCVHVNLRYWHTQSAFSHREHIHPLTLCSVSERRQTEQTLETHNIFAFDRTLSCFQLLILKAGKTVDASNDPQDTNENEDSCC